MPEPTPDPHDSSDAMLLRAGRAGDDEAFLALYRRRQAALFRFAFHMSGSREVAEDAVQEAFLALLAPRLSYSEDRGPLEGFLLGVVRNQLRRRLLDARRFASLDSGAVRDTPDLPPSLAADEEAVALSQAILRLPERYRAVVVLCGLEELSYADAASRLGCAIGTVRSRLHRSRALLEARLKRRNSCPVPLGTTISNGNR